MVNMWGHGKDLNQNQGVVNMESSQGGQPLHSVLSLNPLVAFWQNELVPRCSHLATIFETIQKQLADNQLLTHDPVDPQVLKAHQEALVPLMSVAFPASRWHAEIAGALTPFQQQPFYGTPAFYALMVGDDGQLKGHIRGGNAQDSSRHRKIRAYWLILDKIYGIHQSREVPIVRVVPDPKTGLDRYYRISPDWQFVEVNSVVPPPALSEAQKSRILENITDLEVLESLISLNKFEFRGFIVLRALDVTETEMVMALEQSLIDQESIFSAEGFGRLQHQLRTLFGRPELRAGLGALRSEEVLVINDGDQTSANCIYRNSSHIPLKELENSVWLAAVKQAKVLTIADLEEKSLKCLAEKDAVAAGARSMLIAPLHFKGKIIGTFQIMSPTPKALGPIDKLLVQQVAPLFSVALKRGLDDMNNEVQAIIKEKCTAVHPSVEWRFEQAALRHMDRMRMGQSSEMEPIVFKKVIPLFGQTDIRGSSEARNKGIQLDLVDQLMLARDVIQRAGEVKDWPFIKEFRYRIENQAEAIQKGLFSEAETATIHFLQHEVEPAFGELMGLGPRVAQAIGAYTKALDPALGFVYRKRKEFEESVSMLNKRLSAYLDQEEAKAQKDFPHYFEKHQTDGVDYVIYLGESMAEDGRLMAFHVQNLVLWQLMVACGMARHTLDIQPELKIPLDTSHLILYQKTPLSIRFRYDEKRFDVDGAYDIRHEIIKSRLDKATIKGGGERLTQPGRIAIVYSQPDENREIRRHIEFLQADGQLTQELERVELEDLPGIRGLKAVRVGIALNAYPMAQGIEQRAG